MEHPSQAKDGDQIRDDDNGPRSVIAAALSGPWRRGLRAQAPMITRVTPRHAEGARSPVGSPGKCSIHFRGMQKIDRVAVLGAGTMGSQIAAHFANAGISSLLLDVASPSGNRSEAAIHAVETVLGKRPNPFFFKAAANLIEVGNFDDDLPRVRECDWIIEAVTEDLAIKRALWARVSAQCGNRAIVSTNTSGIQLAAIAQGFSPSFQQRFLGTHFFNPPRYLHLLEIIPCEQTRKGVVDFVKSFGEQVLGKGIVVCKDTPNFIANRIGCFFSAVIQKVMVEEGYSVEEVDELTGPLIGMPKSASFRLIDIIGLDVWLQVTKNVYANTHDTWRDQFVPMPYARAMVDRNWLGEKTGQGFYKRSQADRQIEVLDWKTLEYYPAKGALFESTKTVRRIADIVTRVRLLIEGDDRAGRFLWRVLREVFSYCIAMMPEISDRIVEIDRAMRWGFGHQLGPFELWDGLGLQKIARRMEDDRMPVSQNLTAILSSGVASFYGTGEYLDVVEGTFRALERRPGVLMLQDIKRTRGEVDGNADASLIDVGDGVLCLEFHSKMNAIGDGTLQMIERALELLTNGFEAMVIANEGENFSAGANLATLLQAARTGDFAAIEIFIRKFQRSLMALKYAPKPVVAAAFSRALGGGCEVVLQSHRVQAHAEFYAGLVELNVGLVPAGGGTKEMALRFPDPMQGLNLVASASVSQSAMEARKFGFLRAEDRITMNPELLIGDAKSFALELTKTYRPSAAKKNVSVSGEPGYQTMLQNVEEQRASGQLSDHDAIVLQKLAYVLSGGRVMAGATVTEQRLLDLELEVFLSLCGMPKTQDRIQYMLEHGKPLKN